MNAPACPPVICTGRRILITHVPAFDVRVGQQIVDRWTVPRGTGTMGVAFVRTVLEPARWDHSVNPVWGVVCRGDNYFGHAPPCHLPVHTDGQAP